MKTRRSRLEMGISQYVASAVVLIWLFIALFGASFAPYSDSQIISKSFAPASAQLLLGADYFGRDILSRVIHGARATIGLAFIATVVAVIFGGIAGFFAGYARGWSDTILSRLNDAFVSFPTIMLALIIISSVGSSFTMLVAAIAFIEATRVFRIARALAENVSVLDFIEVSKVRGEKTWWILFNHIIPNSMAPMLTDFGLRFTYSILLLSALSFLGLGVQPPSADWGMMVRENLVGLPIGSIAPLVPAMAIFSLTLAINILVDWNISRTHGLIPQELLR